MKGWTGQSSRACGRGVARAPAGAPAGMGDRDREDEREEEGEVDLEEGEGERRLEGGWTIIGDSIQYMYGRRRRLRVRSRLVSEFQIRRCRYAGVVVLCVVVTVSAV